MTAGDMKKHPMRRLFSNRRGLLAGAAAILGTGLAKLGGAERAEATHGPADGTGAIHANVPNGTTGGTSVRSNGAGIPALVGIFAPTPFLFPGQDGIQGITASVDINDAGVRGVVDGGLGAGVRAQGKTSGIGLWADASSRAGVFGTSTGSLGVFGVAGGTNPNATPAPPTIAGVAGQGFGRAGVYGLSDNNVGVVGESVSNVGVRGSSVSIYGVNGISTSGAGVFGVSNSGFGVYGYSYGSGGSAVGLYGVANSGEGLVGLTQTGIGVHGNAVQSGLAGRFDGKVVVNGTLTVTGGLTTSAIASADGNYRRMYSQESPEPWVEDFGKGVLAGGQATIALDPELDAIVEGDNYLVFLAAYGDLGTLYVAEQHADRFVVRSERGPGVSGPFGYRVVARRRDVAGNRLERIPFANIEHGKDSPRPPEPRGVPDVRPAPSPPAPRPDAQRRP